MRIILFNFQRMTALLFSSNSPNTPRSPGIQAGRVYTIRIKAEIFLPNLQILEVPLFEITQITGEWHFFVALLNN